MTNLLFKIQLSLVACSLFTMTIAQEVSLDMAKETANRWVQYKSVHTIEDVQFTDLVTEAGLPTIYRFRLIPSGYIWIAADYQAAPVLAYSFKHADPSPHPDHPVRDFLKLYSREIASVKKMKSSGWKQHPGWNEMNQLPLKGFKSDEVVEPMLEVMWGQGSGYNALTPDNTPTGCVAVATVQILRHWEWPKQPTGQHAYTHDTYGDFAIDFDTVSFDWAAMPFTAPSLEVAQAMLYTGIALHMNYAPGGSGASTSRAGNLMESTFRFHEKGRYVSKDDFGATDNWVRVIKNELINQRPIIYRGQGSGGHAFNFDGFDGDYFHVNWGWSGSSNGYFLVTSLTPGSSNFSEAQGAIVNLFPDTLLMWDRPYGMRALAGDSRVSIGWSGVFNSELEFYNVFRNDEVIGRATQRHFSDSTAVNGNSYAYSISAVYRTDTADYESDRTSEMIVQPAAGFAVPFIENFEDGVSGWQMAGNMYGFRHGNQLDLGMGTDTTNHFVGINSGSAGQNKLVSDYLISNGFSFEGMENVVLSFDYAFRKWQDVDQLILLYRIFENNEWVEFAELEATKGYHDWVHFKTYLPKAALTNNVQLAFYYTDQGEVGYGAGIDNMELIHLENPGVPEFSVSVNEICLNTPVVFTDNSQGTIHSYSWDFGLGAEPRYADTEGPHTVTYKSSGPKSVSLVLNDLDEEVKEDFLTIVRPPKANFSKRIEHKTVTFSNTSSNASIFFWDFGDGVKVSQESPAHTYELSGDYLVTLVAMGDVCDNDTIQKWVSFNIANVEDLTASDLIRIFPNPVTDILNIDLTNSQQEPARLEILNLEGRKVFRKEIHKANHQIIQIDLSQFPAGVYYLRMKLNDQVHHHKIVRN